MSSPPTIQNDTPTDFETLPAPEDVTSGVAGKLLAPVQFVGFWTAVALPLGYPALLYTGYLSGEPTLFAALLVLNLVAAVVGHGYKRD